MWLGAERNAASAPSIAAWRRTASNLSRTAGSIMRGRSGFRARGARPFRLRLLTEAFAYFPQNGRCRVAGHYGNGDDAPAGGFHFFAAHNLVAGPVAAFHEDIREQARDHFARRQIIENNNSVHGFQSGENFGALALRDNRTPFAFQLMHAGVAIQTHDQRVSQGARQFQAANMAGMKQVEAAVGEDHAAAVAFVAAKLQ